MEAGSDLRNLKGQNSLQSREIFLFLYFKVLSPNKFQISNLNLISFAQKGILIPVLSGFMFLFLLSYSVVSSIHYDVFIKQLKDLNIRYSEIYTSSSNLEKSLKKNLHKAILYNLSAPPRHSWLKEIPDLISSEAPSSEPDFSGIIASSSRMLNQYPCL